MNKLISLLFLILLTSCASPQAMYLEGTSEEIAAEARKQKELVLQKRYEGDRRVMRVSFPILVKNVDLCGEKVGPSFGMGAWSIDAVEGDYREAAKSLFGLDQQPALYITVGGSPAARAGLDRGDKIIAVDGHEIEPGRNALRDLTRIVTEKGYEKIIFTVLRNGEEKNFTVKPIKACNTIASVIWGDPVVNAFADGKAIHITEGMMKFVENDDELALAISHELAHNGMGHVEAKRKNALGAGIIGFALEVAVASAGGYADGSLTNNMMAAGAQAYSVEFEQEADYVGMYMLARAGYPTEGAANFWRRMAAENDARAITTRGTHPTSPERFVAIEKAHDEIRAKVARKEDLKPNIKPKSEQKLQVDDGGSFDSLN